MGNVQVRLPDEMEQALEAMAGELHTSRSEVMRNALAEGLSAMRLERALTKYTRGDLSLEGAARAAGVSLTRMAGAAADRGVPYMRYSVEEAEADRQRAIDAADQDQREGPPPGAESADSDDGSTADGGPTGDDEADRGG